MILRDHKYVVPEALQKPVIKLYHDYAHVSAPKTQQLIQRNFWWPQMASDIQRWCDTCIVCATINQEYHLSQAQVETNLARKTAQILSSSSTRSAQTAYTWWDWVLRGCAVGSALIFSFTLFQCCYFRHLIRSVKASTNTILTLSPLKLPTLQRLK
ncbi:unnamed protein product [Leuciscus chuanchicus]